MTTIEKNKRGLSSTKLAPLAIAGIVSTFSAASKAQPTYSVDFHGHDVNCATLQGANDPFPGDETCEFIEEVEQYIKGPKLSCPTDKKSYLPSSRIFAAQHLADAHKQPGLLIYQKVEEAKLKANKNSATLLKGIKETNPGRDDAFYKSELSNALRQNIIQEVDRHFPGQGKDFYNTYTAMRFMQGYVKKGLPFPVAAQQTKATLDRAGFNLSQSINSLYFNNPVIRVKLECNYEYPNPAWSTYENH